MKLIICLEPREKARFIHQLKKRFLPQLKAYNNGHDVELEPGSRGYKWAKNECKLEGGCFWFRTAAGIVDDTNDDVLWHARASKIKELLEGTGFLGSSMKKPACPGAAGVVYFTARFKEENVKEIQEFLDKE